MLPWTAQNQLIPIRHDFAKALALASCETSNKARPDSKKYWKIMGLLQKSVFYVALGGFQAAENGDESTNARSLLKIEYNLPDRLGKFRKTNFILIRAQPEFARAMR
jgi:hypothetical protein